MTNRNMDRVSRRKGRISWLLTGVVALAVAMLVGAIALGSSTAHAGEPTPTPTETNTPEPTATEIPGVLVFLGSFDVITDQCGGGNITLIGDPDPADPTKVSAITRIVEDGLIVSGVNVNELTGGPLVVDFTPPISVGGDGSFSLAVEADVTAGDPPAPLTIETVYAGMFDFSADPATVAGSLTFSLVASPPGTPIGPIELCVATFSATFQPGPPPTPGPTSAPAAAATATSEPDLPGVGSSGGSGSSSNGALWAIVAGIVGVLALGTAGVASLRPRRA